MDYVRIAEYSQIASAVLFVAVMVWIWIKLIQPAVVTAQQNANARLAEAEAHRDHAKAALDSLRAAVAQAENDATAIRDRAASQAQSEREAILREAREAGERAVQNARGELQRARGAARERFRDELLESALTMARSQAGSRIDDTMNARILSTFINSIGAQASPGDNR